MTLVTSIGRLNNTLHLVRVLDSFHFIYCYNLLGSINPVLCTVFSLLTYVLD